jgi:Tfp pilus assembly protein PilO
MSREAKSAAIVAACFAVLAAIALYFINEAQTELENLNAQVEALNASIADLQKKVDRRPALEKELEKIQDNLAEYIKILPSAQVATPERLQELVQEKLDRASVQITQYVQRKPRARGKKKSRSAFQEVDLTLQAKGSFDNFVNFLNSLERHETFLRVNSFTCTPKGGPSSVEENPELTVTLNVSTFRYQPAKGKKKK